MNKLKLLLLFIVCILSIVLLFPREINAHAYELCFEPASGGSSTSFTFYARVNAATWLEFNNNGSYFSTTSYGSTAPCSGTSGTWYSTTLTGSEIGVTGPTVVDVHTHSDPSSSPSTGSNLLDDAEGPTISEGWTWVGNGNSSYSGTVSNSPIGSIPAGATNWAFAIWADESGYTDLSGDQGNYTMSFNGTSSCTNSTAPGSGSVEIGCVVFPDTSTSQTNYTVSGITECGISHNDSTGAVTFNDTSTGESCHYAVFYYSSGGGGGSGGWTWQANGNSTLSGTQGWTSVATIPSGVTKIALSRYAMESDGTLSGDQGNYAVTLGSTTCTADNDGPWAGSSSPERDCTVLTNLGVDWTDSSGLTPDCGFRYVASTRSVQFGDEYNNEDCGIAVYIEDVSEATATGFGIDYADGYNREGPNVNTNFEFTAGDDINAWELWTGSDRTGTRITYINSQQGGETTGFKSYNIAHNDTGIIQGSQTIYLTVSSDDNVTYDNEYSTTLLVDSSISNPSVDLHSPDPVLEANDPWSITFDALDTYSTGANEMSYEIRNSAGGGSLLTSGSFTQGSNIDSNYVLSDTLSPGDNTRYLRIWDGAGNASSWISFVVFRTNAPDVTTDAASSVTQTTATLNGTANPTGFDSTGWFRYYSSNPGPYCSDSGGTRVPASSGTSLGSGTVGVAYNENITGLTPGATYYVCAFASNTNGTGVGSWVTFSTSAGTPTSVTNTGESNLGSYYVTLNASANPNNFASYGFFRLYTSDPGSCTDSGGTRYPSLESNSDLSLGSSSTSQNFSYDPHDNDLLTPSTTYYYCAFARNAHGIVASSVDSFTTLAGAVGPCDPPLGGNHTITGSCYYDGNVGGVDGGTGTINNAILQVNSNRWLQISPGQLVAWGSLRTDGSVNLGGGALRKWPVWVVDADNDGYVESGTQYIGTTPPAGGVRRNTVSSNYSYHSVLSNYTGSALYDCNDASSNVYRTVPSLVTDADNDGYKTSAGAASQCVGDSSTINGRTYYENASGNFTWLPSGSALSGGATDCYDNSGAPCPPASVSASGDGQTEVDISWSASTGPTPTSYKIQWCSGTSCTPSTTITGVSSTYNHTSRTCDTVYGYRVIATNASGDSTASSTSYATTGSCVNPPTVTTNAASSITASGATLNGAANPGGGPTTGWFRYSTTNSTNLCNDTFGTRAPSSGGSSLGSGTSNQSFSRSISGLSGGTTYYFCAIAENSAGKSGGSVQSVLTVPSAPTSVSANAVSDSRIDVSWNSSNGATSYRIYRCTGSSCTPTTFISTDSSSPYPNTNLSCGTTYRYRVTATNSSGESPYSSIVTATTDSCATVPTVTASTPNPLYGTSATFHGNITSNGGASITARGTCWGTSFNPTTNCSSAGGTATGSFSHERTGLSQSTSYYYRAYADNSVGRGYSSSVSFTTPNLPASSTMNPVADAPPGIAIGCSSGAFCLLGQGYTYGLQGFGWFRYSTTNSANLCNDSFGTRLPAGSINLGYPTGWEVFGANFSGTPGTTYYYCAIVSSSGGGPVGGGVRSFVR